MERRVVEHTKQTGCCFTKYVNQQRRLERVGLNGEQNKVKSNDLLSLRQPRMVVEHVF